jgi:2-polyprenyl-3-methyl-5-hydroxy-6-metoxy-1,4-benzoquinol methylase
MNCRFCKTELTHVFCDLGHAPPSNSYVTAADLNESETYYPLKVWTCNNCFLTQIDEFKSHAEIFSKDYAYFSSISSSWVAHAKAYVEETVQKRRLTKDSMFIEVASNDGYLLQSVQAMGIPCLGIEPAGSVAKAAREKGIDTREIFFGEETARQLAAEGFSADAMIAVNVIGHVPDILDFVKGFAILLKPEGVAAFEIPHLLQLVQNNQFDTIYHEHFQYLSVLTLEKICEACGLKLIEVEELKTHGGSIRVHTALKNSSHIRDASVDAILAKERTAGMDHIDFYKGFQPRIDAVKYGFLSFLLEAKKQGKKVAAYGAAAKGNTLLNYCGVKPDLISFVCDLAPSKQGLYMPGSHIPILPPSELEKQKPDIIVILPWNIRAEITKQLAHATTWGATFAVAIPEMEIF